MVSTTSVQDALQLVRAAFEEVTGDPAWSRVNIDLEADLRDLGIDSAKSLELSGVLGERLSREFSDNDFERVRTVADLIELIRGEGDASA